MLVQISTPTSAAKRAALLKGMPLFRLGFRPFYFAAALFACVAVPFWLGLLFVRHPVQIAMPGLFWHAHEMLYGFAVAVIVGFLMTAGKAWTGLPTPRGKPLAALVALWLAARVSALTGPYPLYAALDIALLPVVACILCVILLRAKNRRNLPLVGILVMLALANIAFHLSSTGVLAVPPMQSLHAALALVVMIACVMAGRVVPAFTAAVTPGLKIVMHPKLEQLTLGVTALALILWVVSPPGIITMMAFLAAAGLHLYRQSRWHPWGTRGRPILWILHAAYGWIAIGFALLALAQTGVVGQSIGLHALAVGLIGGLIIGMITRTARGHTGRTLRASRPEVAAYILIMVAALVRVVMPIVAPGWYALWLFLAAGAWSIAFVIYLALYGPWLFSTRVDGKDG
ncbi:MAG: NnrS family protein [Burkholderiaceae bacterium]|nr:NnrS family protein [Burkholderiaceae bacterium]